MNSGNRKVSESLCGIKASIAIEKDSDFPGLFIQSTKGFLVTIHYASLPRTTSEA
jgi:hypothetical protein